jgi:hypothetical protein
MKRVLPVIAAALLGLASGWFLRGESVTPPEKKSSLAAAAVAAPAKSPAPASPKDLAAVWKGDSGSGGPEPFSSLEELIALVEGVDMDDEAGMMEMMTGIPRLLSTDLATTRRLLTELEGADRPHGEARGLLAVSLLARWMMQEPEASIEFGKNHPGVFGSSPDSEMMQGFTLMGVVMMAKKNPASARSLIEMLPKDNQTEALEMVQMIEASRDPESALKALPADGSGDPEPIVSLWARRDPQAALRWIASQAEEDRENLTKALATGWAKKDWKGAAQWASSASESNRAEIYSTIAASAAQNITRENADSMLAGLPPSFTDRVLLALEYRDSSGEDSDASATRIMEILKRNAADKEFQAETTGAVLNAARKLEAAGGGKAAADWALTLPPGPAQDAAAGAIAGEWAAKDAEAASAWLATLAAGPMREKAAAQLIEKISSSDPERAFEWAKSLTGGEARTQQIGNVLRAWLPQNPFAAMKAIQSLPEEMRAEIWSGE